jgi:hypothetical protein
MRAITAFGGNSAATTSIALALVLAAVVTARPADAQLPSASAAALGMGDNYTVMARGINAPAWNPAGLGMPGNPRFSFSLLPVRGYAGLDPVTLSDVAEYDGVLIPDATKELWLQRITASGSQQGQAGADITAAALSIWRFAVHVGAQTHTVVNLSPDAAEILLFGNAGRTGEPRDFVFDGSQVDAFITSTAALSYAQPIPLRFGSWNEQRFSLGVTVKRTTGHGYVHGRDLGSTLTADPLEVDIAFPIVQTDSTFEDSDGNYGRGMGLDIGAAWTGGPWRAAVTVKNVFHNFSWDTSKMYYRPGTARFDADDSSDTEFDVRPYSEAPAAIRETVEAQTFEPVVSFGGAYAMSRITVSADLRQRVGDGIHTGPKSHIGFGLEARPVRFLPIRLGAAKVTGGTQLGAGAGLEFGGFNLGVSAGRRTTEFGAEGMGALTVSIGTR